MTGLPYVLIVLFAMSDGSVSAMRTAESYASPLKCSMRAFLENETARDRTYVCVTRDRATTLAGMSVEQLAARRDKAAQ
jgi:hypothetical protein